MASLQPINQYAMPSVSAAPAVAAAVATVTQPNNELLQFIEKQEGYIEQLERESQFCRVSFSPQSHLNPNLGRFAFEIIYCAQLFV